MADITTILLEGDHASRPAAGDVAEGTLYSCSDHDIIYQSDGAAWNNWAVIAGAAPGAHATSHQNGGSDEMSVAGLSGLLADGQTPIAHKTSHENGGADEVSVAGLSGLLADGQTPLAHASSHQSGGGDAIKLDDLAAPDDNTDLNASITKHGLVPKLPNDATKYYDGTGAYSVPAGGGGGGGGVVVQVVHTQTGATASGTTSIPLDDTIPQITEGDEYLTQAITPTDAANLLRIDVVMVLGISTAEWLTVALFQDATANALAATTGFQPTATGMLTIPLTFFMVAGTTSATTFRVRAGRNASGTVTFNGSSGRKFGGVCMSGITITEIVP